LSEIRELASGLRGLRIFMVNSTPRGGGVAEILKSLIPLMKGVGLDARWYTIIGPESFFRITEKAHKALQSKKYSLSPKDKSIYLNEMKRISAQMKDMSPDIWFIHDPQPAGIISFKPNFHPAICRLHIDLTSPNRRAWNFISGFVKGYDRIIVSSRDYLKPEIAGKTKVFSPAIDPLAPKNQSMDVSKAEEIIKAVGISMGKPLVSQISRFDVFKDPLGVIKAYKAAKKKISSLQLILVGFFLADDDPDALNVYKKAKKASAGDKDIFLFSNADKLGGLKVDTFVNAVQTVSDVILQKSIKEGFGLTVTEAMWKRKPVIGGNVGGIKLQIKNRENGFLVDSPKEASERIVEIIKNPKLAQMIGLSAQKTVRDNFLIPRLLKDYLKTIRESV